MLRNKFACSETPFYCNSSTRVSVYYGRNNETNQPVVIKKQIYDSLENANLSLREALLQSRLDHSNIVQLYTAEITEQGWMYEFTLIVEYVPGGDLFKEIQRRKATNSPWSEQEIMKCLYALVHALEYAQSRGVVHRDIKPQNIFLQEDGQVKIGDFGCSANQMESAVQRTLLGSLYYLSPEMKAKQLELMGMGKPYDPAKSDVFSLAVTITLMATLVLDVSLPAASSPAAELYRIVANLTQYPNLQPFLLLMIKENPEERVSFTDLRRLLGQFFQNSLLLCSACNRIVVNTAWFEYSQRQNVAVCSESCLNQLSKTCFICKNAYFQEPSWPQELQKFRERCGMYSFCSEYCMFAGYYRSICIQCYELFQDSSNTTRLGCGHSLHLIPCFPAFLSQRSQCSICSYQLSESDVKEYQGTCNRCSRTNAVFTANCGHSYCASCLTTQNWQCMSLSLPNLRS